MSYTTVSEAEVKEFVFDWYRKVNAHPPVDEMLEWLADEEFVMRMPEQTFLRHDGFKKWYQSVERFHNPTHIVKALKISTNYNEAIVKVISAGNEQIHRHQIPKCDWRIMQRKHGHYNMRRRLSTFAL